MTSSKSTYSCPNWIPEVQPFAFIDEEVFVMSSVVRPAVVVVIGTGGYVY